MLLVDVRVGSLTGKQLDLYALYDPSLGNDGMDDSGGTSGNALLASDAGSPVSSAMVASPAFTPDFERLSGTPSDGGRTWRDFRMDGRTAPRPTATSSRRLTRSSPACGERTQLTVALGFGATPPPP